MFRSLPLEAVWQEKGKLTQPPPLQVSTGDELVDDHLCAVGKIAELRLPDHQRVGARGCIAILETQHCQFRQQRVDDLEAWLPFKQMGQRDVAACGLLIVVGRMAMREGAANGVLTGQADRVPVLQQGCIGEDLRHPPVDREVSAEHATPLIDHSCHAALQLKIRRRL